MKRITLRADQVRVGDRFAKPETGAKGVTVTDVKLAPRAVEVSIDTDPLGMPVTLAHCDRVEVWR